VDNEPEFRRRALAAWSEERRVRLEFIQPGKPVQNAWWRVSMADCAVNV